MVAWEKDRENAAEIVPNKHCLHDSYLTSCELCNMPDEIQNYKLLLPPCRTGGDHQDPSYYVDKNSSWTWNPITSPWMKQLTGLRIVHSREWCLRLALCTPSGACQRCRKLFFVSFSLSFIHTDTCIHDPPMHTSTFCFSSYFPSNSAGQHASCSVVLHSLPRLLCNTSQLRTFFGDILFSQCTST